MKMLNLQKITNQLSSNPRQLFIFDGFGALLSAFLLGVVLVNLEKYFGIPKPTLYFLAFLPILFALYDFYVYKMVKKEFSFYLKIIAIVNLLYCVISIGLAFYHNNLITHLGWIYIVGEIIIVASLAIFELQTASKLISKNEI